MEAAFPVDLTASSRVLLRTLRSQPDLLLGETPVLPESVLWRCFLELRQRGDERAESYFLRSLKQLHRRRSIGTAELPCEDPDPQEHKLVEDPMLAELWKAYKRCICAQRTGPAAQLLRDLEAQLVAH